MILEEETFERFGYYPSDVSPKSGKKVVAACDDCGKIRIVFKFTYHARCSSCSQKRQKGENNSNWKGGLVNQICKECGVEFPVKPSKVKRGGGKFCSLKCTGKWRSKQFRGENHPNWKNGISFEPYCIKFNLAFKEYIREKFGRICFLCDKTEEENGRKLDVHHVNYNKNCGCDDDETCQFVPLCISCNSKVNKNRDMWEKKIKDKMKNKLNGWYI